MKLAFITPTAFLHHFATQGDFHLALAHLVDDNGENEYTRFYRREAESGKPVILDNGLFEGAQVEPETLIQRARVVKAQVVCAPDVLYDSRGTIKEFKRFIRLKHEEGLVAKIMGIPQADNRVDYWECFQFMLMHKECDLIGLSILSIPKSFKGVGEGADRWPITASRMHFIQQLHSFQSVFGHRIKPCHLLGLGESYADIFTAKRLLPRTIISNDSSSAFVHGLEGQLYTSSGILPHGKSRKRLDFSLPYNALSEEQISNIQKNIDIAKKIRKMKW